jgi:hypothetical protein
LTRDRLARISAWCIALYAVDVLRPIVEIFGLPLPSSVASISLSVVFIIGALGILISLAKLQRIYVFGCAEIALIWIVVFWSGLAIIDASGRIDSDFNIILGLMPLLLTLMASRLHLKLFCNTTILVGATVLSAILLVLAHTIFLLILSTGIRPQYFVIGEVMGRNGIASLGPVCLWILAWYPLRTWTPFGHRYNLLLLLALTNVLLNSARMALFELIWCVIVGAILCSPRIRRLLRAFLIPACFVLILMVTFSFTIVGLTIETGLWGVGDDATSVLSRSYTNYLLLDKFMQNPLLGIGWGDVVATKALGYMGHTGYVNILTAYGVIGALPLILILVFGLLMVQGINREVAIHLLFLVVLFTSFNSGLPGYLGVMVSLVVTAKNAKT